MASLYTRHRSPFYWIKYRDEHGKIRQESTGCRLGIAPEVRRAKALEAQRTMEELRENRSDMHSGWNWVTDFLKVRYSSKATTFERYNCIWPTLKLFLADRKIDSPAQLLRAHCFEYVEWRKKPDRKNGKYAACHNTALLELKILRLIMREAVERGLCGANPCAELHIAKEKRKLKPELTDEDCDLIRAEIPKVEDEQVREMLANSFEIARYQGCRLTETQLNPMRDVDLTRKTIRFRAKGGKEFLTTLHPKLIPLFERLRSEKKTLTWTPPKGAGRQWASSKWYKFLDGHGLKAKIGDAVCFHSTRVTVVTRLARADVPISKAKSYVGHASTLIHETYQRLNPDDVAGCTDAVG